MKQFLLFAAIITGCSLKSNAQLGTEKVTFNHDDTLRGSLNANRTWWDVQRYEIEVTPDFAGKSIVGKTVIEFKMLGGFKPIMQIDLQAPLIIDSAFTFGSAIKFSKSSKNVWEFEFKKKIEELQSFGKKNNVPPFPPFGSLTIYYHGIPKEGVNPPWDGGWIWKKDKNSRQWMSVAVQGLGASAWYPCKDYQGDEPDKGASLTLNVDSSLVAVANGNLVAKNPIANTNLTAYKWNVVNPINNYCIIPYIGKYLNWNDTINGEKGKLNLGFWALDYNVEKAKIQFEQVKPMMRCFEHWFGPYPFYEDGYKLIQAPHLGMEHQSAVAYGNGFKNGYLGRDLSGTGWGLKWDYIIIHESGHEWFANNITTADIADMWVHEGFTMYSEVIYTEWLSGKKAANEYCYGVRKGIENDRPIIGAYGVNKEGSGDMYYKGANMIHFIRQVINDDEKFRQLLRGLNNDFYHKIVTTKQIQDYINNFTKIDFNKLFGQYLTTTQIPVLEVQLNAAKSEAKYRFSNCVKGFTVPMVLKNETLQVKILPTEQWKTVKLKAGEETLFTKESIESVYYLTVK